MIRISGILNVKSIKGSRGIFSVGELTSEVGSFKVKDQILDQFSEGSYEGEFLVAHIYPASYVHYGKVITEIRAKLAEIILPQGEEKPLPEQSVPQEPDPVEEAQAVAAAAPAEAPADAAVDTQAAPGPLTEEEARDLALFGAELYGAVTKRDPIKLDPTVDRLKFRAQRDRLKGLGYRFDAARQAWGFEAVAAA
jgi:hypothetical protein